MDILGKIVQGSGCAVDGTVAAQNPLSRAMDSVLQSQVRGAGPARGMQGGPPPPAYVNDLQMQMQRQNFAQGADAQFLQNMEQEAMHRSRMEAAFRSGEAHPAMMQQPRMMQHHPHQASFEAAFEESKRAVPMHHHHHPGMQHRPPPMQDAWVNDFKSLHVDDAWASAGKTHHELAWDEAKAPVMRHPQYYNQPQFHQQMNAVEAPVEQVANASGKTETQAASAEMARVMSQNPDPKWQNSEFLQFMNEVSSGKAEIDEEKNEVHGASVRAEGALEGAWEDADDVRVNRDLFETSWQHSEPQSAMESAFASASVAPQQQNMDEVWSESCPSGAAAAMKNAWNDSHTAEEKAMDAAWDDGNSLEAIWEKAMNEAQSADPFEDAWGELNQSNEYVYKEDNPFLEASDNFKHGMALFESGHLNEAILAFEAEVQQHPENSEAWRMLGECHAENDEDKAAIVCLERAVEEDPYNLSALLALGVSNVNELNPQGALKNLKAWVQHNPKFHGLEIHLDEYSDGSLMDEVMQLMLQARAHDANDSDVQVVLGVLYNVSKDYDAAARSFQHAAQERPQEYSLWNKIGATLANSSRSTEAIPSYHKYVCLLGFSACVCVGC